MHDNISRQNVVLLTLCQAEVHATPHVVAAPAPAPPAPQAAAASAPDADVVTQDDDVTVEPPKTVIEGSKIVLNQSVNFGSNNSVLKDESRPILNEVANILSANPQIVHLTIEGHCSNAGDSKAMDEFEMRLSQERAETVLKYLVSRGVEASRLKAVGFGDTRPIATNATSAGRALNRRVEFVIVDGEA